MYTSASKMGILEFYQAYMFHILNRGIEWLILSISTMVDTDVPLRKIRQIFTKFLEQ